MKSTMWVNWMPAKDKSKSNSLRGVSVVCINICQKQSVVRRLRELGEQHAVELVA
jgi:hypothetical protein